MPTEKKDPVVSRSPFFTQLAVVFFYFAFFYDAALSFRGFINLAPAVGILIAVFLNGGLVFCAAAAIVFFLREKRRAGAPSTSKRPFVRDVFLPRLPMLIVIVVFSVMALLQFGNLARYDAGLYYSPLITSTETFSFQLQSLLSSFALSTHPTQGFAFLIGAGEMLFPMQNVGVYAVTLVLTIASLFCLYEIISGLFPKSSSVSRALCMALFALNPYVLGLFSYTTPDYYLTIFFIILVWAFQKNWHILGMFAALLVCFSKEPGILFAASFLLTAFVVRIVRMPGAGFFRKAVAYMWPKNLLLYGFVPAIYLIYFKTLGSLNFASAVTNASPLRWDNEGIHCFGISIPYIGARLSQLLVYNFLWIALCLGLAVSIFIVLKAFRRDYSSDVKSPTNEKNEDVAPSKDPAIAAGIVVSTFVYVVFSCLFITHMCPRYAVCMTFPAAIVILWAVSFLTHKRKLVIAVLSTALALFVGQCFFELDPSISLTCKGLDLGAQTIYSPTTYWYTTKSYLGCVGEYFVHNQMYTYTDDLTVEALKEMDVKDDDVIVYIFMDYMEIYLPGDPLQTEHLIYWDPVTERRTYEDNIEGAFVPLYKIVRSDSLEGEKDLKLPDQFYLMTTNHTPPEYLEDFKRRGYEITDSFTVENHIGLLHVYTFEKLPIKE